MIPAAVAARLRRESFRLWSPRSIMTAVQERVLLDPGRAPALSNAALELIMTRFKEHDFSLSAARRAMHLLTLDHFMTQPLSAQRDRRRRRRRRVRRSRRRRRRRRVELRRYSSSASRTSTRTSPRSPLARRESPRRRRRRRAATAPCDELLTPKSLHWARKNLGAREGRRWVPEDPEEARAAIADALADAYCASSMGARASILRRRRRRSSGRQGGARQSHRRRVQRQVDGG